MASTSPGAGGAGGDDKKDPSIDTSAALTAAATSLSDSITVQQKMMVLSAQANTAMAYLQMALGITGKLAGR